jgi:hypothetical protein
MSCASESWAILGGDFFSHEKAQKTQRKINHE